MPRPRPTPVFHFTRVEHLETIAASGLHCDSLAQANGMLTIEVGDTGIKARRSRRLVPLAPGGFVGDYAPFYFAPRSPMMYSIAAGNVPTSTWPPVGTFSWPRTDIVDERLERIGFGGLAFAGDPAAGQVGADGLAVPAQVPGDRRDAHSLAT